MEPGCGLIHRTTVAHGMVFYLEPIEGEMRKGLFLMEPQTSILPVFVGGNLDARVIPLFGQGGGADSGIDWGWYSAPFFQGQTTRFLT